MIFTSIFLFGAASALVKKGTGKATFYADPTDVAKGTYSPFSKKQLGACGPKVPDTPNGAEQYFVAMDSKEFNANSPGGNSYKNPYCHRCMKVTHPDNGKQIVAYLTDSCVGCGEGNIDLSLQGMSDLVGGNKKAYHLGILRGVNWELVDCPNTLGSEVQSQTAKQENVEAETQPKEVYKEDEEEVEIEDPVQGLYEPPVNCTDETTESSDLDAPVKEQQDEDEAADDEEPTDPLEVGNGSANLAAGLVSVAVVLFL